MLAGRWRELAAAEVDAARLSGKLPVVVGGTGLYLRALIEGLSPIPDVPIGERQAARQLLADIGNEAMHRLLRERDPVMAARLDPGNSQRLVRAWEVLQATGRSLAAWQSEAGGGLDADFLILVLDPPRAALYAACDRRFLGMMEAGALDEVAALERLRLDPALPVMKAVGIPPLRRLLRGEIDRARPLRRRSRRPATTPSAKQPGSGINCPGRTSHRRNFRKVYGRKPFRLFVGFC